MVVCAEFTRMGNGECLHDQEQGYPEPWYPVVLSDWRHGGAILHDLGPDTTRQLPVSLMAQ